MCLSNNDGYHCEKSLDNKYRRHSDYSAIIAPFSHYILLTKYVTNELVEVNV